MKRLIAAAFFAMLVGAMSCSSNPCTQTSGCPMMGSSSSASTANCNSNSATLDCAAGYHQVGTGANATCISNTAQ